MEQVRTTIRLPAQLLKSIDTIRKTEHATTLSDFIRRALEHYVQETRRKQLEAECTRLALEEDLAVQTEVDFPEHVARMAKAERRTLMAVAVPRPGEIYRVGLEGTGHVLNGPHYAVVISDEPFNYLSTIVVVPLSTSAKPASFRPEFSLNGKLTRALTDQIRAIDKTRIKEFQVDTSGTSFFLELRAALAELLTLDY